MRNKRNKKFFANLDLTSGKTEKNVKILKSFLDATGGREDEPDFDEAGQPLTRSRPSLSSLKGGIELGRMPVRVARRMAQDILKSSWSVKY